MTNDNSTNSETKVRLFTRGPSRFGVLEREIAAIVDWQTLAPLPHAPESVMGVAGVHGRMLTVLDVTKLGEPDSTVSEEVPKKIIALRGDEQLALAADDLVDAYSEDEVTILSVKDLFAAAIQGRERRQRRF